MGYTIWLEFEEYYPPAITDEDGFCNIAVNFDDGWHQGYNVWTADFFRANMHDLIREAEENGFATGPDLIVSRLDREHITQVLKQILPQEDH